MFSSNTNSSHLLEKDNKVTYTWGPDFTFFKKHGNIKDSRVQGEAESFAQKVTSRSGILEGPTTDIIEKTGLGFVMIAFGVIAVGGILVMIKLIEPIYLLIFLGVFVLLAIIGLLLMCVLSGPKKDRASKVKDYINENKMPLL